MQQKVNVVWFLFYIINRQFQVYFFADDWITGNTFLMSVLVFWEISFNVFFVLDMT